MEVSGKIIAILPISSGVSQRTGNPWMTQTFVLETNEQYPRRVPFEVFGEDKLRQFNIQIGESLTVHFNIDGREWQGRWFAKISCYNVIREGQEVSATQQQQPAMQQQPPAMQQQASQQVQQPFPPQVDAYGNPQNGGSNDNLPF